MFAFWLSGIKDQPERSGEICVAEIFGDTMHDGGADIGMGVHRFRDPELIEDFWTVRRHFDPSDLHVCAVDWAPSKHQLHRLVGRLIDVTQPLAVHAGRDARRLPDHARPARSPPGGGLRL
jgi:hypothetical protein